MSDYRFPAVPDFRPIASGRIVEIDSNARATFAACGWWVEVASDNPEPDSIEDCYKTVDCGEPLFADPGFEVHGGHTCAAGHTFGNLERRWAEAAVEEQIERAECEMGVRR